MFATMFIFFLFGYAMQEIFKHDHSLQARRSAAQMQSSRSCSYTYCSSAFV